MKDNYTALSLTSFGNCITPRLTAFITPHRPTERSDFDGDVAEVG